MGNSVPRKSPPKRAYADSGVRKPDASLQFLLAMPPAHVSLISREPSQRDRRLAPSGLILGDGNDSFHQFTYGRGGGPAAVPGARPGDRSAMAPESGQSRGCS